MGQSEVIKILEKAKEPMSNTQIAEQLNDNSTSTSKDLRILLKNNEIKCVELDRFQSAKLLGWKNPIRRTRFYYIEIKLEIIKKWGG